MCGRGDEKRRSTPSLSVYANFGCSQKCKIRASRIYWGRNARTTGQLSTREALTGRAIERLGAGLSAQIDRPDEITGKLISVVSSEQYAEAARRFANRYADFDPQDSIARIVTRIEGLLEQKPDERDAGLPAGSVGNRDAEDLRTVV